MAGDRGIVLCSNHRVPWKDFLHFITVCIQRSSFRPHSLLYSSTISFINRAITELASFGETNIVVTLKGLSYLGCDEPRERVFRALGLANSDLSSQLAPEYSLSVQQMYTNTATSLIQATDLSGKPIGLSIWMGVNHSTVNKIPGLPSWVPGWSCISARYSDLADGRILPCLLNHTQCCWHSICSLVNSQFQSIALVDSQFQMIDKVLLADGYSIGEIAFNLTMRSSEDLYDTIIGRTVQALAKLGLGSCDPCPGTGTLSYLSVFCRFLHHPLKLESIPLDFLQSHTAFLAWNITTDPNTPEVSRKLPPGLEPAVEDYTVQSSMDKIPFDQEINKVCLEMETLLQETLNNLVDHHVHDPLARAAANCDLYCTRSGHLGIAGEGAAEPGLHLFMLQGLGPVAMMRKRTSMEDEWYEFVDGADILQLDWGSCETLDDIPIDGNMQRLKIL
jgi:hypothetical protein